MPCIIVVSVVIGSTYGKLPDTDGGTDDWISLNGFPKMQNLDKKHGLPKQKRE
jgi:hypothetical protein